ncbi:transporter substrate-binding domain-containing protein [Vaginisenegalia massiliensis]|uniref:transporter substrate-binding domain-containing protein n=1 Tax=Vaginisenegalia massiliensis TaxID=2058294 RepID=UPI000F51B38D|nr:transporter substrate-binding domain-containing protein [Vaginisenegalia massiliensis]
MKQKRFLIPLLMICFFCLSACSNKASQQDILSRIQKQDQHVITWGVKADTNLFGIYNIEAAELQGFDIDIAKALTAEMTQGKGKAVFTEVTGKTRVPLLKNGNIDVIIATMTITPERQKIVDFSSSYFDAGQSLLVPNNSPIQSVKDLTSKDKVLVVKGTTAAKHIKELAPQTGILELDTYNEAFTALASGQGQAMSTDNSILLGLMKQNKGYKLVGGNFTEDPYGIAVNKGQKPLLNEINRALETLHQNGTYDKLYLKWFGTLPPKEAK